MKRKGQAALEFLTTYGWAFLVILIMIGALAYFGVLNPKKFVPDTCTFGSMFVCDDHVLDSNSLTIKMKSNMPENFAITSMSITDLNTGSSYDVTDFTALQNDAAPCTKVAGNLTDCPVGGTATWVFDTDSASGFPSTYTQGEKEKFKVDITYHYTKSGPSFSKTTGGDIVATVQ